MLGNYDWVANCQFKRYKVIFRDSINDNMFLMRGNRLGQVLTSQLRVDSELNTIIAKHANNPELRFCNKCGKPESRKHYIFYCECFMKQCNLLRYQINQISESFT